MRITAAVLRNMKAPTPYAESEPIKIETIELAAPGPEEFLIRIRAAGLCHSDLSVINGDRPRALPMALGHEAAGVVEALGERIDDLQMGDHVVMVFMPSCGHCASCAEGRPALCEPGAAPNAAGTLLGGAIRLRDDHGPIHHHLDVSAFAERAVVSRHSLVKIDKDLPLTEAAVFGCAVLTGVGAVVNTLHRGASLPVNIVQLVAEERTLKGCYLGTCVPARDVPRFIELYRGGRLPVNRLLSSTLSLEDINSGFDRLQAGTAVRQIIEFNQ